MDPAQLLRFVTPDETAAEFFARQAAEALATGVFCVDAHARLRPGHVLEVAGPTGAGKTALLTEMAARFVAAAPHGGGGGAVGGAGGAAAAPAAAAAAPTASAAASAASAAPKPDCVVYVDLDCKFDPLRLLQLLRLLLNNDDARIEAALARFHLVRCRGSAQLLAALATLPQRLAAMRAKCSLLLVDNVGAFTWQDRASRPSQPPAAAGAAFAHDGAAAAVGAPPPLGPLAAGPPLTVARVHAAAAALLQLLAVRLRLAVVAAKSAGVSWADGGTRLVQRETLPAAWQRIVTHRLLLAPGRPAVVHGQRDTYTHVAAQLTSDAAGVRGAAADDVFLGACGAAPHPA